MKKGSNKRGGLQQLSYPAQKANLGPVNVSMPTWHMLDVGEAVNSLHVEAATGLQLQQSQTRAATHGSNRSGESLPVANQVVALTKLDTPLTERLNMACMNTLVTRGRAEMRVIATGMLTEMGKLSRQLADVEERPGPFQVQLDQLGKRLAMVAGALVGMLFVLQLIRGETFTQAILDSITLAVTPLQAIAVHWPPAQTIFHTTALTLGDWVISTAVAASVLLLEEARKLTIRILKPGRATGKARLSINEAVNFDRE